MPTRPADPLEEISTLCACFNVRRAARAVTQLYDRELAPTGLRATQVTLLVALARAGGLPFTRLAAVLGMDRTTLTRNLAPLERDGLLTLRPGADRRVKLATITAGGREVLQQAIPLWRRAQRQITEGIGAGRWDAIRRELQRITELSGDADPDSERSSP
ncbi:MAG TPA: MarR family winged helix-turn-helix transcriptional regulator [Gemmatimonadales bacterium]|nr:MarR family winged helix-turn-helix transcriptional regulator [Gemmatimonadales bacterium]